MKTALKTVLATLLLVLAVPTVSHAHESIFTFRGIDGDNLIMVTHNVHDAQAGVPISYNIRLYTMGGQLVPFERVQAQIKNGGRVLEDTNLSISPYDDATLTYSYPKRGDYTLLLSFLDHGKQVAHGSFPIVVQAGEDTSFFATFFSAQSAVAFGLGIIVTKLYLDRRNLKLPAELPRILRKKK